MRASHLFVATCAFSAAKALDGLAHWGTSVSGASDAIVFGVVGACFAVLTFAALGDER